MHDTASNETASARLIARLADRVRTVRKERGMARRVLSERSGVSPRYLAQLEAGQGNISVALLQRVAMALDVKIESLIAEDRVEEREANHVAQLYLQSSEHLQLRVLDLLLEGNPRALRAERICLIGLEGAGKSTLGAMVSEALRVPFADVSEEIFNKTGLARDDLFKRFGPKGAQALEGEVIQAIAADQRRVIIAVTGDCMSLPETFRFVLERFHTVWIKTNPAECLQRLRSRSSEGASPVGLPSLDQIKSTLTERSSAYEMAGAHLDTSNQPVTVSAHELIKLVTARGFLDGRQGRGA